MNQIQERMGIEPKIPPHILLMEDEVSLAKGLQMVLTEDGYSVDLAMTGMGALDAFRKNGFDLLVADLRLPDIDGMEVIKKIKEERPETEVIVITGYSSVSSVVEAMKAGVSDYLPKPFTEDEFRSKVERVFTGEEVEIGTTDEERKSSEVVDVDIPFERDEVVKYTSENYASMLGPSDMPIIEGPALEILRNFNPEGGMIMNQLQESMGKNPQVPPHILLMEDEVSLANGLQMVLTEEGYAVDLAMTGMSAIEAFLKERFDLLVADLRLPDIDGMEVIKKVKEDQPETEVIVITGYSSVPSAVEAMKVGVADYLPKPFTEDEFKVAVEGALKEKQQPPKKEAIKPAETEEEKLIQKREVIRVLNRTAEDRAFWRELMESGSSALDDYTLSLEAKGAIVAGDLRWINEHVGELTQKQLMFIYKRLEREAW